MVAVSNFGQTALSFQVYLSVNSDGVIIHDAPLAETKHSHGHHQEPETIGQDRHGRYYISVTKLALIDHNRIVRKPSSADGSFFNPLGRATGLGSYKTIYPFSLLVHTS